jgi:hypothetical protein
MRDHSTANPFDNGIVPDAWAQPAVDVPGIHGAAARLCLSLLAEVRTLRKRRSLVILGSAGSGKTHVLTRLRRTADVDPGKPAAIFCYVRLTTSPNMIRRHLRACLVHDLVRHDQTGVPHLESLLLDALVSGKTERAAWANPAAMLRRLRADATQWAGIRGLFDELCARLGIDYDGGRALRLFLLKRHRRAVIQWLSSGSLPEEIAERLGFEHAADDEHPTDSEQAAYAVTRQLVALVTATRPLVLCFDQVEAMQLSANDGSGFFAFGKLAADLFDHGNGMLMITCVQTAILPQLLQAVAQHDWHRIAQHETRLEPLTDAEARELIKARLDASVGLRSDPRHQRESLWPIGEERFRQFLAEEDRTPRQLCRLGREAFFQAFVRPLDTNTYLSETFEQLRVAPPPKGWSTKPAVIHALALALAARSPSTVTAPADRPDVDLVLTQPGRRILISVCNEDGAALAQRLKRIADHHPAEQEERVVVRNASRPIPRSARKAWEYWDRLHANGGLTAEGLLRVRTLAPTEDTLASLEAIRSIVSDARAGDLEAHGATVKPATVDAWLRKHLLDESIEQLVSEIEHGPRPADGTPSPVHDKTRDAALETLQTRHVMRIGALAASVACDAEQLRSLVAADANTFGTLGTPPALVFERVVHPS